MREYLESGKGCSGRPLPSFKMAIRKRALSGHMTRQTQQDVSPRVRSVPGLLGAEGRGAFSAARGPVRAEAQPPPLQSRGSRQVKREPCRSGSGAATCAPTAAARVSDAGGARSPRSRGRDPWRGGPCGRGRGDCGPATPTPWPPGRETTPGLSVAPRGGPSLPRSGRGLRQQAREWTGRDRTGTVRKPRKASDRSQTRAARGCRCFPFPVPRLVRVCVCARPLGCAAGGAPSGLLLCVRQTLLGYSPSSGSEV